MMRKYAKAQFPPTTNNTTAPRLRRKPSDRDGDRTPRGALSFGRGSLPMFGLTQIYLTV